MSQVNAQVFIWTFIFSLPSLQATVYSCISQNFKYVLKNINMIFFTEFKFRREEITSQIFHPSNFMVILNYNFKLQNAFELPVNKKFSPPTVSLDKKKLQIRSWILRDIEIFLSLSSRLMHKTLRLNMDIFYSLFSETNKYCVNVWNYWWNHLRWYWKKIFYNFCR